MKRMKKILSLILTACILGSMVPAAGAAKTESGGPNDFLQQVSLPLMPARSGGLYDDPEQPLPQVGTSGFILDVEGWTPMLVKNGVPVTVGEADSTATVISDAAGLQAMKAGNYVLDADIDLTDVVWEPIKLKGSSHIVLDGQGHTIKGLKIDMTGKDQYGGLIGELEGNLTVKNLRLADCSMNTATSTAGASNHGILAGVVDGELYLENVAATGLSILLDGTKMRCVGGLVGGVNKSAVLRDISVESKIIRSEDMHGTSIEMGHNARVGGVIGYLKYNVDAQRCYVKTTIDSFDANCSAGGMLGCVGGLQRTFKDCMVDAKISARNTCGGLVGDNIFSFSGDKFCRMENCVVLGDLSARYYVGGYFGDVNGNHLEFTDSRFQGTVTVTEGASPGYNDYVGAGGLVGQCAYAKITARRCAADATFKAACADSAVPTVAASVGAVLGYGDATCDLEVIGCNLKLKSKELNVKEINAGAVCGKHFGSSGYAYVRDTFAETQLDVFTTGSSSLGGMVACIGSANFINCGADVNIDVRFTGASSSNIAGMCQHTDSYASYAKCYTTGSLKQTKTDDTTNGSCSANGLGDVGQVSQCYSGVDITINAKDAEIGGLIRTNKGRPMASSWSSGTLKAIVTGSADIGGLIKWNNNASVTDSCFRGIISTNNGGDLGGIASRGSGTFRNCYAHTDLANGRWIGGIVGADYIAATTNIYDCRFEGSIRNATQGAAGITTYGNGGTIARCQVDANIYCPDVSVGGVIAGDYGMSTVRGCTVKGSISGAKVGGIAGDTYYLYIYDCSVSADLDVATTEEYTANRGVGGIAYAAASVRNSHVLTHLNVSDYNHSVEAGGVLATVTTPYPGTAWVVGCSSKGITCRSKGSTDLGGIVGGGNFVVSDCRVDGDVRLIVSDGTSGSVGGIAGYTGKQIYDCVVNGYVSLSVIAPPDYTGRLSGFGGGIAGKMLENKDSTLSRSYHVGSVGVSCSGGEGDPVIYTKHPLVGRGGNITACDFDFEDKRENETCMVRTYWHEETDTIMQPLEGVEIAVAGSVVGTTDASGTLMLNSEMLMDKGMTISAEKDGYRGTEKIAWFADNGVLNLYLMKKTPGKIYLKAARIYDSEGEAAELLYTNHTEGIQEGNHNPRKMYFEVDWNDLQEEGRVLRLVNQDETSFIEVTPGIVQYVDLNSCFTVEDQIWLKATAIDSAGEPQSVRSKLGLDIQPFKIPTFSADTPDIPLGDNGEIRGIDFLSGLDMGVKGSFNDNILDFSFINNQLKIKFGATNKSPAVGFLNTQAALTVTGEIAAVPAPNAKDLRDAIWSGGLNVEFGLDPAVDYSMSVTPLAFSTEIKATIFANVNVGGTLNNPSVTGVFGGEPELDVVAGPGIGFSNWRVIAGPNVGAKCEYKVGLSAHDATADDIAEVAIEGDASFAIEVKAGEFFEFQPGYQIGRFRWSNTEGMKVYAFGFDVTKDSSTGDGNFSEGEGAGSGGAGGGGRSLQWIPSTRQYLAQGGGFAGVEIMPAVAALNGWSAAAPAGNQTVYENIALSSRADLAVENGVPVLYFTADDESAGTEGTVASHTALWRSEMDESGSWSAPEKVETAGYADDLDADGPFSIWVESDQTDSLEGLLTSTDIMVSVNGVTTQLTNGEGYVYGAKISSSANGQKAQAIWFSDSAVDGKTNLVSGNPKLCYAQYNGSSWSAVRTVDTGSKRVISAAPSQTKDHIYWMDDNGSLYVCKLYRYARSEELLNSLASSVHDDAYTAAVVKGSVCVWQDNSLKATLSIQPTEMALIHSGDNPCLVWTQKDGVYYADAADDWKTKTVVKTDVLPQELSAVMVDGRPMVSYCTTSLGSDEKTLSKHLHTAKAPDLSGVDLNVTGLVLEEKNVAKSGLLRLSAQVTNLRTDAAAEYTYVVTDESGKEVYSGTETGLELTYGGSSDCFALFPADTTAQHTYTLTVTAVGDVDTSNNSACAETRAEPELVSTGFPLMPNGFTGLESIVGNAGAAPVEQMTVEIFKAKADGSLVGEPLISESFENVPAGSYRQVMLERTDSHQLYKVVLTTDGVTVDSDMLMWKDEAAVGLWVGDVSVDAQSSAEVDLFAQNWTKDVQLHLALYQQGKMVASAMETLSAWDGEKQLQLSLSDTPEAGSYTCSVFLLEQDSLVPLSGKTSFSVTIP